jgi:cytochrome c biogenesis protein CcmG/thiol:disulfide interchange protein DsbE
MVEISEEIVPVEQAVPQKRRIGWGRWLVWVGVIALLLLLGFGLYRRSLAQVQGGPAPDFELATFTGQTVRLSALRGRVVVINFWASWCIPCREEAAYLEGTWREYKDRGVVLVFIGVDYLDTEAEALAYIDEFDITYPNGPDIGTRIAQSYRIRGVPETFFIAKDGTIRDLKIGPLRPPELEQRLEALLKEGES